MNAYTLLSMIRHVTQATLTLVLFTFPRTSSRTTNWWDLSLRLFFSRISPACLLPCTQNSQDTMVPKPFWIRIWTTDFFGSKGKCSGPKKFRHSISNLRFSLERTILDWSRNTKTISSIVLHQVQSLIFNWSQIWMGINLCTAMPNRVEQGHTDRF